ncbi:hypothetical protein ACFVOB_15085 [Streptomyces rochei]|uniref:hypothetical protein n=1 Tax=Streptomyces rochei TaxID=1928 RepID=UPI0036D1DE3E
MTTETTRHTSNGMHTRLVATAADVISRAMQQGRSLPAALAVALDSAQMLQSPETAAEHERVRKHAQALEAAAYGDAMVRLVGSIEQIKLLHSGLAAQKGRADTLDRLLREAQARVSQLEADRDANDREYEAATARLAEYERPADEDPIRYALTESAPLTVYRASHDSIPMGLYTTAAEARKHCETELRREWPNSLLDWIEDEEDAVAELVAENADGETPTGYVVEALEVAAEYDEEADQ